LLIYPSSEIDIVSIVLHQHLSLWIRDLEEAMSASDGASVDAALDLEQSLSVYQKARKLQNMGLAFGM